MPLKLAAIVIFNFTGYFRDTLKVRWRIFMMCLCVCVCVCAQNYIGNLSVKELCNSIYICRSYVLFIYLFKNFTVTLKCKLKEKLINDNSRNRKISRRCTNRYLQCKHGAVQSVQAVCSGTITSNKYTTRTHQEMR